MSSSARRRLFGKGSPLEVVVGAVDNVVVSGAVNVLV